jgi:hypothetical protein
VFYVKDGEESLNYYTESLGFSLPGATLEMGQRRP